jgi:hypothetical protein
LITLHSRKAGLEETDELSAELTHLPRSVDAADDSSVVRLGFIAPSTQGFGRMPIGETVELALASEEVVCFLLGRIALNWSVAIAPIWLTSTV